MAIRFDRTQTDVLVVCDDCGGSWRRGPFPVAQEAQALATATAHVRTAHQGSKALSDQLSVTQRRRAAR